MPFVAGRRVIAAIVLAGLIAGGYAIHHALGREAAFAWVAGGVFGFVLQRSRFCFFCNFRDFVERREAHGVLAILLALAVGLLGYHVITGAWIVDPSAGHLPPKAHIAPAGWNVVLGGLVFGFGMALSGSCISAHLYRLGEGAAVCLFALAGLVPGFVIGLAFWNPFYLTLVSGRQPVWLPAHLGFFGSLVLQLLVLAGLSFAVWKKSAGPAPGGRSGPVAAVFVRRWPGWVGGLVVGLLSTAVLLRLEPLGVTSEFFRLGRSAGDALGLLPERLEGLDVIRGCNARPAGGWMSRGLLFLGALVLASLAAALASGEFSWQWPAIPFAASALGGGVLMGLGATWSFGCTVGTLLSGVHASSLSGWIFGAALVPGILAGLPLRRRLG